MATQAPELVGSAEIPTDNGDFAKDMAEVEQAVKIGGLRVAMLIARNSYSATAGRPSKNRPHEDNSHGGKHSIRECAIQAKISKSTAALYRRAWDLMADAGLVDRHADDLMPGEDCLSDYYESEKASQKEQSEHGEYKTTDQTFEKAHKQFSHYLGLARQGKKTKAELAAEPKAGDSQQVSGTETESTETQQEPEAPEEVIASGAETPSAVRILEEERDEYGETPTDKLLSIADGLKTHLDNLNGLGISGIRERDKALDILADIKRYADEASDTAQSDMEMLESPTTQENSE